MSTELNDSLIEIKIDMKELEKNIMVKQLEKHIEVNEKLVKIIEKVKQLEKHIDDRLDVLSRIVEMTEFVADKKEEKEEEEDEFRECKRGKCDANGKCNLEKCAYESEDEEEEVVEDEVDWEVGEYTHTFQSQIDETITHTYEISKVTKCYVTIRRSDGPFGADFKPFKPQRIKKRQAAYNEIGEKCIDFDGGAGLIYELVLSRLKKV